MLDNNSLRLNCIAFLIAIIPFFAFSQKTFTDSTSINCSYANGVATIYPSPLNIPANVATNATGNITVTFKYAGQLLYSYEYLSLYGENNYFLTNSNNFINCGTTFSSQNVSIPQNTYSNWLSDGQLIFGITSTTYVNNSCSFKTFSNINFCTKIIVSIDYFEFDDDAGITNFILPTQNTVLGSQPVVVSGFNYGLDSLSSVNLGWSVNGVNQTSKALTFNPPIAPNNNFTDTISNYTYVSTSTYNLKAWTNSPNGNLDSLATNDTANTTTCVGFSGVYTVGSATNSDYPNLNAAYNDLKSCGLYGPLTLSLTSDLTEQIEFQDSISGLTETNKLTIKGNGFTLKFNNNSTSRHLIWLNGINHLVIDSLNFETQNLYYGVGIYLSNGADSNIVKNCYFDITNTSSTGNYYQSSIMISNCSTSLCTGTNGSYNEFSNNTFDGGYYGVAFTGLNTTGDGNKGNIILNNHFKDNYYYGIFNQYADSNIISGNNFTRPTRLTSTFFGIYNSYSNRFEITKNKFHNMDFSSSSSNDQYIIYNSQTNGTSAEPNKINNNLLYDFKTGNYLYFLYEYYGYYTEAHHNTINYKNPTSSGQVIYGVYNRYTYLSNYKNNNFYFDVEANSTVYSFYYYSNSSSYFSDYNNVKIEDSQNKLYQYYGYASGNRKTASDMTIYFQRDLNSLEVNPRFQNDTNLTPKNVLLNNAGDSTIDVSEDYFGVTRNSPPDIGAIEFTPISFDLGLSSVNLPDSSCGFSATQIQFEVGNYGINTYSSFTGFFQVDNGPIKSQTFTTSMASGVNNNFTFDSIAQFPTPGNTYNVNVWINATNDGDASNDSINGISVKNLTPDYITLNDSLWEDFSGNTTINITGTFANSWKATPENNYFWTIENYYTQSGTGPYYDHTLGNSAGRFAFVQTSTYLAGQEAFLESPCFEISDTVSNAIPVLTFWYHKYGSTMGDLVVQIQDNNLNWVTLDSIVGQTQTTYTEPYIQAQIDLTGYKGHSTNIRFKAVSLYGVNGDMAIDDIKIKFNPITCDSILISNVNSFTDTSADISWQSNLGASLTQIQWGQSGFSIGSGTIDSTTVNSYSINGLTNLTEYQYYLRNKCANGNYTVWSGPYTIFTNNYCNTNLHNYGCATASGINNVQFNSIQNTSSGCSGLANNFYSFYPNQQTDIEPGESYSINLLGEGSYRIYFGAWIDYNKDGDFDDANEFLGTVYAANSSTTVSLSFTAPSAIDTGISILRIRSDYNNIYNNYSCTNLSYGETEDYLVDLLPPPTCPKPSNLGAGFETTTSTRLFWNTRGYGSSWEIEYGSGNFTKGNGTTINTTDTNYILSGLNAYSNYDYYVRSICGAGDSSKWAGPLSFNTYPYCYNGLHTLGCSQSTPYDVGLVQFNTINNSTSNCPPGSFSSFSNLSTDVTPSQSYSLTIKTNNQASLNMGVWIDFNNDGDFDDANEFVLSGTSNTQTTLSALVSIPLNAVQGNTIMRVRSSNSTIYNYSSCASLYYGETEDYIVNILPAPTCPSPNNLYVNSITSSSAIVNWTSIGSGTKWLVQYDTAGFSLGNGTIDSSLSTNFTINNLQLFGTYNVYIKEVCSSSDSSGWTGPISFNINPYCTTNLHYSYSNCTYEIDSVKLGNINYYDQGEPCPPSAYHEMFNYSGQLNKLDNYTLRVRGNSADLASLGVWIDWNGDGTFNTTDEFLGYSYRSYNNIFTASIAVPINAKTGRILMRVRSYNGTTISSTWGCTNFGYGETMDFPIDILEPQGCVTPFNLASNFNSFTSANIAWTDYSNTNLFEIEYDTIGYTFGTGTRIFSTDTFEVIQNLAQNGYYDYYVRAICDTADTSGWSSSHSFTTFPYCTGNTTTLLNSSYSCYYKLSEFQLDTFYKDFSNQTCPSNSYSFDPSVIQIEAGSYLPISYNTTSTFTSTSPSIGVWIDFNHDGDFDDANEFVSSASRYDTKPYSSNITIPSTVSLGTTIMRVRSSLNAYSYSYNSCTTNLYGDVKDFAVDILPPPSCPKPYNLITYGTPNAKAARIGFTSPGNGNAWEVKVDTVGFDPNVGGASSFWSTTIDSVRGLDPFTTYDIYVREICSVNDSSSWVGPLTITTNPYCTPTYAYDCSSYAYYINSVSYNNNILGGTGCSGNPNNYSFNDQRSSAIKFESGNTYALNVNIYQAYYTYAWVDWDKDGQFTSAEGIYIGYGTGNQTLNLDIPSNFYGNLMVRIRTSYYTLYNYDFCSYESYGETEDYLFNVTLPDCPNLASINLLNVSDSSISIQWSQISVDSNTIFNVKVNEISGNYDSLIVGTATNPYTIFGLNSATQYSVKVQNNCISRGDSLSNFSDSLIITTDCGDYFADYEQGFDGPYVGNLPICWEVQDYSTNTNNAGYLTGNVYSGFRSFYAYRSNSSTNNYEQYLVSPKFGDIDDGDKQARFFAFSPLAGNKIIVGTTKDNSGLNTYFNPLDTILLQSSYQQIFIDLKDVVSGDNRIALKFESAPYNYIYIDEFHYETKPACKVPTNLNVSYVSNTSAVVTWDTLTNNNYLLSYGFGFFGNNGINNGTFRNKTTNGDTITGLFPNVIYRAAIQQLCSIDSSFWNGPFTFRTLCNPDTAPTLENFNSVTNNLRPTCWNQTTEGIIPWQVDQYGTSSITGPYYDGDGIYGGKYIYLESTLGTSSDSGSIITQPIATHNLNAPYLYFDYHAFGNGIGTFKVSISDDFGNSWKNLFLISGAQHTSRFNFFNNYQVSLKDYKNKVVIFRVTGTKITNTGDMAFDNFKVDEAPPCGAPYSLSVSNNYFGDKVSLSWDGADSTLVYRLNYGLSNQSIAQGTTINNGINKTYNLSGLSSNTAYQFYVKAVCTNDSSSWIGPIAFTTSCNPTMAPITEDFSNTYLTPPTCWTNSSSTGEIWQFGSSTLSALAAQSGSFYAFLNDNNSTVTSDFTLETQSIIIDTLSTPILSFWHWSANNTGSITIQALQNGNWLTLKTISGSTNYNWKNEIISLVNVDDTTRIRFIGTESQNNIDNYQAIDFIEVKNGNGVDLSVDDVFASSGNCGTNNYSVNVSSSNNGIYASTGTLKLVINDSLTFTNSVTINGFSTAVSNFNNLNLTGGEKTLKVYFEAISSDKNRVNDSLTVNRFFKGQTEITVTNDSTCSVNDTLYLSANGANEYLWYENSLGSNYLGNSNSIQLNNLTSSKTYYVKGRSNITSKGGFEDFSSNTALTASNKTDGLIFDVFAPLSIDSLTIYPNGSGDVIIKITNNLGATIAVKTVNVPYGFYVAQRIALGVNLPAGEDFKITLEGTTAITWFRSNSNLANGIYPIEDDNSIFSITSSTEGESRYHYFYDWKVSTQNCYSALTPVTAAIIQLTPPTSSGGATYCEGDVIQPLTSTGDSANLYWYKSTDLTSAIGFGNSFIPDSNVGNLTYQVREAQGNCFTAFSNQSVNIKANAKAQITADTTICQGQTVRLYGSGASKLTWSNNSTLSNILVGPSNSTQYWVAADNQNGCKKDTAYATVFVNQKPNLTVNSPTAICFGDSALLVVTSNQNISWSNNLGNNDSVWVAPNSTSNYYATATDSIGCSNSQSVSVVVNSLPNINAGTYNTYCPGDTVTLTASGGISYIWNETDSSNSITAILTSDSTFNVVGYNTNGCINSDQVTITLKSNLNVFAGNDTSIAAGNSINLDAAVSGGSGNYSYLWSPDSLVLSSTSKNTQTVALSKTSILTFETNDNNNGCSAIDYLAVNIIGGLVTANPTSSKNNICAGDSIQLFANAGGATGNYTYNWSPGYLFNDSTIANPKIYPTTNTVFTVEVSEGGSSTTENISIVAKSLPFSDVSADTATCIGESVTLKATGGVSYAWSNNSFSDSTVVSPIFPTTYRVTVTGNNGCAATEEVYVTTKSLPTPTISGFQKVCIGDSVTLTAAGGTSYQWVNGGNISNETFVVNNPQNFSVIATASNGCSKSTSYFVSVDTLPKVNAGNNQNLCAGDTATLTANGALTYSWSNNLLGQTILVSPNNSTNYFVYGTDINGCTNLDSVSINLNLLPTIDAGNDTSICIGDSAFLNASGGNYYFWNNGKSTAINEVSPTSTATYIVTVADLSGCYNYDTVTVTVNPLPNANAGSNKEICLNQSATLIATGGNSYSWSNGGNIATTLVTPTASSYFEVEVTDNNGCSKSDSVFVKVNSLPIPNAGQDVAVCYGDSASFLASGGNSYSWNSGSSSANEKVYSLSNATYTVTVTDTNNCSATDQVNLTVNSLPSVSAGSDTTVCSGIPATLTASGATSYAWSNGDSLTTISVNPSATQYFVVTGTDANGCSNIDSARVFVNQLPQASASNDTAICIGDTATLNAIGGQYYFWNNGSSTANNFVSPTVNSNYIVTVADANGCFNYDTVSVVVNNLPIANAGLDTSVCIGNSIVLTAAGGASNFDYSWSSNQNFYSIAVSPNVDTRYFVTVTDGNGCKGNDSVFVVVNSLPTANAGIDTTICFGDTANLSGSGGVTYSWSNNASTQNTLITPTQTNNYYVTVTDGNGCTDKDTVLVSVNQLPNVVASADTFTCWGAPVQISATGTNSLIWENGDTNSSRLVSPLVNTTFYVVGTDGNGCSNNDSVFVMVNSLPTASISVDTSICIGDSATLRASGGDYYFWNNGGQSSEIKVSPTTNASFIVTVANLSGCYDSDTVSVTVNQLPIANAGSDTSICFGSAINLNANGGSSFTWSNGSQSSINSVSPTSTQTFNVTVTDNNFCSSVDSITVSVWGLPSIDAGIDQTVCEKSQVTLSAVGYGDFVWSNGDSSSTSIFIALDTNNYVVSLTDSNGCKNYDTTQVFTLPLPNANAGNDTSICLGETAQLSANGGQFYVWNNGGQTATINVTPAQTSSFIVTVVDQNSCFSVDTTVVNIWQLPNANAGINDTICVGDQTSLTATGGVSYLWNTGAQTASIFASPVVDSTYLVTVTDINGCQNFDSTMVFVNTLPMGDAGNNQTLCFGDTAYLNATGGINYQWSNNLNGASINFIPTATSKLFVTVTNSNKCSMVDSVEITLNALPNANAGKDTSLCWGASTFLMATGGVNYIWSNGPQTASNFISPTVATTYIVTVTDANNCVNTDTINVGVNNLPTATVSNNKTICQNDSVELVATGGLYYYWSSGQSVSTIKVSPGFNATFIVTVADVNGCYDIDSVDVTVNSLPSVSLFPFSELCDNGNLASLSGGSPAGGTYKGPFVSANKFNPQASGAGTFQLYYAVTNLFGCKDSVGQNLKVNPAPNVNLPNLGGYCLDVGSVALSGGSPSGGIYSGQFVTGNTFFPSNSGAGNFVVNYLYTDVKGCSSQDTAGIIVHSLPQPNLGNDTTICINIPLKLDPGNFVAYQWSNAATTPTIDPTKGGIYSVTVTDVNGCVNSDEVEIEIDVCPSVDELSGEGFEISYFPNPAKSLVNLTIAGRRLTNVQMVVTDINGSIILQRTIPNLTEGVSIPIDLSGISTGVYFIKLNTDRGIRVDKLIIN